MRKILPLAVGIVFLVLSCSSVSVNDSFLVKNLDDQAKAQALTNEGVQEFDLHLNHRQEFDQIPQSGGSSPPPLRSTRVIPRPSST